MKMVRKYIKMPGSRNYQNYSKEDLEKAVNAVKGGMSKKRAAILFKIPRATLVNRCLGRHNRKCGHPTVLYQQEQQVIADTLGQVSNWDFPLTKLDIRTVFKKYLDKQGRVVSVFKDNYPGEDFIDNFLRKNNLSVRMATNIKRARSSVGQADVLEFFNRGALLNASLQNIYNYHETNIANDPGAKKVIVPRNFRRVERVQNYSRSCTSIMVAGNAAGQLLPPMVVYKTSNLYENWCTGGNPGTVYWNTISGWFDMSQFEKWFASTRTINTRSWSKNSSNS
ncbi:unnamed protein product [Acanthoscelides obtectus]|uniref:HTH psq-type domain-containing protein n=1 Tax=Acanthoscelides obtectus TaxID=200917 RepID=A0A9P0NYQ6_ACAOB|nr:unnamed protein product [Acanthoscelides obtectus]CAK1631654.1 hypothetical protein AOBTE_LOCUS7075 [Acanthoscelides obtectus]